MQLISKTNDMLSELQPLTELLVVLCVPVIEMVHLDHEILPEPLFPFKQISVLLEQHRVGTLGLGIVEVEVHQHRDVLLLAPVATLETNKGG